MLGPLQSAASTTYMGTPAVRAADVAAERVEWPENCAVLIPHSPSADLSQRETVAAVTGACGWWTESSSCEGDAVRRVLVHLRYSSRQATGHSWDSAKDAMKNAFSVPACCVLVGADKGSETPSGFRSRGPEHSNCNSRERGALASASRRTSFWLNSVRERD